MLFTACLLVLFSGCGPARENTPASDLSNLATKEDIAALGKKFDEACKPNQVLPGPGEEVLPEPTPAQPPCKKDDKADKSALLSKPKCSYCNGHGQYSLHRYGRDMEVRCWKCGGSGEADDEEKKITEAIAEKDFQEEVTQHAMESQAAAKPRDPYEVHK